MQRRKKAIYASRFWFLSCMYPAVDINQMRWNFTYQKLSFVWFMNPSKFAAEGQSLQRGCSRHFRKLNVSFRGRPSPAGRLPPYPYMWVCSCSLAAELQPGTDKIVDQFISFSSMGHWLCIRPKVCIRSLPLCLNVWMDHGFFIQALTWCHCIG